jgi:lipoprotein-anchoring transpeptidase ErfK/SrfK
MQRLSLPSLIFLSTMLACSTTRSLAGPFGNDPPVQRGAQPSGFGAASEPATPIRRVAAQGEYGGGFLEFLFRGGQQGGSRYEPARQPPAGPYPAFPADLGPGMVESPNQPGYPVMDPRFMKQEVSYEGREEAGTIIINTRERMLYLVRGQGRALRYGIGVGRPGFTWSGVHHISQKREWPDWTPPDEMLKRRPDLPRHMVGGPDNPLGARAMYLGSTLYRIHGSNEPWTIGTQVSSGCIRMRNEDVMDLYGRVKIGTKVVVI